MRTITAGLILAGMAMCSAAQTQPRTRNFHFEYKAIVKGAPAGSKHVELWAPVPHDDEYQKITNLRVDSPYSYKIATGHHGNSMLHVAVDHPAASTFTVTVSFDAVRMEHI